MTKRRIHAEPRRYWTPAETRAVKRRYPHEPTADIARDLGRSVVTVYQRAALLGLSKTAAYLASPAAHRLDGVKGMGTRFQKGSTPWNKGTHWTAGGRSALTRFKPGNVSKRWDPEVYVIGALRINTAGGLDIKVRKGLRAWDSLARYVWTTERGPIPKGYVIRVKNGDQDDTRIENLECISRVENMRRNTYHRYGKEIARVIQLRGALTRQINKRTGKHERQHDQRPA